MDKEITSVKELKKGRSRLWNVLCFNIFGGFILMIIVKMNIDEDSWLNFWIPTITTTISIILIWKLITYGDVESKFYGEDLKRELKKIDFEDNFTLSADGLSAIKISESEEKLYYATRTEALTEFNCTGIDFKDILDVSVSSNGNNQISVNKGGLIGGAAIGGALFGGFGAVVGAMSANKTSTEQLKDLTLVITINDLTNPIIKMKMYNRPEGVINTIENERVTNILNHVDEWFGKFTIIMKRNESI